MKKIFTLMLGSLLMLAASAADRKPTVTINSTKKYEVVIDGRSFQNVSDITISTLRAGNHSIQVYQVNKGFFLQKRKIMVASSSFQLKNKDITINVDMFGKLRIVESKSRFDRDRDWNDKDWNDGRDRDNHDRDRGKRF